ncbi:MAG: CRISPR-associated DxTHG motif protein [Candidatus Brocadia sp.]|nr:MAG: CRISPR-associated DxTHG motif protein [Candidatus Brocadia sp.]
MPCLSPAPGLSSTTTRVTGGRDFRCYPFISSLPLPLIFYKPHHHTHSFRYFPWFFNVSIVWAKNCHF